MRAGLVLFITSFVIFDRGCLTVEEGKRPIYLSAHVGESVVFSCELDFPHDVVIPYVLNWNKEGKKVFSVLDGSLWSAEESYTGRVSVEETGNRASVNLSSIREPDRGWYECRVMFPNRTPATRLNGTWFHLTVHDSERKEAGKTEEGAGLQKESVAAGSDLLGIPPINQTVMDGEKASFECLAKDLEARVTWLKDGQPLSDVPGTLSSRTWVGPEGTLTISPTGIYDSGMYTCKVTGKAEDTQNASAFLDVQYKARVLNTPRQVFLSFGRYEMLDCNSTGNPAITVIRWEKDGFLYDPFNVQGVYLDNSSLLFTKVDESHAGEYTCTPYNDLGTAGPSPPITVHVRRPLVFTITPHHIYFRKVGDTIQLICDANDGDNSSRPTILWSKKDGSPFPADRTTVSGGNLTINNITDSDKGLYVCMASNEAANISTNIELFIENPTPKAPHNLTGNTTHNNVNLHWASGFGSVNDQYSVWFKVIDGAEWRTIKVNSAQAAIGSLEPGREYEFMVVGEDQNGERLFSKPLKLRTKGKTSEHRSGTKEGLSSEKGAFKHIGPPRNLRVALNLDGYTLHWDVPEFGGDLLEYYKVHWAPGPLEFDSSDSKPIIVDTTDTSYFIGELGDDSTYHFQVKAVGSNDYLAASDMFILHIPSYKKSQLPLFVAASVGFIVAIVIMCVYSNRLFVRTHIRNLRSSRH